MTDHENLIAFQTKYCIKIEKIIPRVMDISSKDEQIAIGFAEGEIRIYNNSKSFLKISTICYGK